MNILKEIQILKDQLENFKIKMPLNDYRIRLEQIDFMVNSNLNFWNDTNKATKLMKERKELDDKLSFVKSVEDNISFYQEYENVPEFQAEIIPELVNFKKQVDEFEMKLLFDKPEDRLGAIVSINSGQGGDEAKNWVFMVLRMFLRYCEDNKYKTSIVDEHRSEENSSICIDSITIEVEGDYAYGNLKAFNGVLRLIRNSPFSSADARHTSFAAVQVLPLIDDEIEVKLDMKDVEFTPEISNGSGGQKINRTYSACRIKYAKENIQFKVQNERDFHQNKARAINMLKSKLYDLAVKRRQEEEDRRLGQQSDVAFGSQIMTFTFTPYSLCADHRTGHKENNVHEVMDGNLQGFTNAFLQK